MHIVLPWCSQSILLPHTEWGCDLDLCKGVGWGPPPKLLGDASYFGCSKGQGGGSKRRGQPQGFPGEGLPCVASRQVGLVIFQHLVYLWRSGKQKKEQGLLSSSCHYCPPGAAPLLTTEALPHPHPWVPWSSVHILLYQCGFFRRTHTTGERFHAWN